MANKKDSILDMQITTVPGMEGELEEELEDDYDKDIPPDDYQEHINNEVKALKNK